MEVLAAVQPLVMTQEGYAQVYGEDDPEELSLLMLDDLELAGRIDGVLADLYFLETHYSRPLEGAGLAEEVGQLEDLLELRRIAAALHGKTPDEYQEGDVPPGFQFNHLINHAGTEGYYLPVDFPQAFALEELSLGSAVALLRELDALRPVLLERYPAEVAVALETDDEAERAPVGGPAGVWHSLSRLCRSAIALDMPIHMG